MTKASSPRSLWSDLEPFAAPRLEQDLTTDVVVVGAGMAGLSVAYEAALTGREVAVLDPGRIGAGLTALTAGQLGFEADDLYVRLIKRRGLEQARQIYESQRAAVDRVEEIVRAERLDCGFQRVDGYLIPADVEGRELIDPEFEACQAVGLTEVAYADEAPIAGIDTGACLRFPGQARFDPARYVHELTERLSARGVRFFAETTVTELEEQDGAVRLTAAGGQRMEARAVVVATASPLASRIGLDGKQAPYRTYLMAASVPKGSADILLWDTASPQHYVRLLPGDESDLLIVGGEDHRTGRADDADERFARLEVWARGRYPALGEVVRRWSGTFYEPTDHAPFIGRYPGFEQVFGVTGDSRQGLTTGAAAGLILRELLAGRPSAWAEAYDPARTPVKALGDFLRDNLSAAASFFEQVTGGDAEPIDEVERGEGAIVRAEDGGRAAAYRSEDGGVKLLSATCTHAPCTVQFNSFEQCWDCPCHGCQYGLDGTVLNGPAFEPLAPA